MHRHASCAAALRQGKSRVKESAGFADLRPYRFPGNNTIRKSIVKQKARVSEEARGAVVCE